MRDSSLKLFRAIMQKVESPGGGVNYFGVKRIGMTVGNPRKLP